MCVCLQELKLSSPLHLFKPGVHLVEDEGMQQVGGNVSQRKDVQSVWMTKTKSNGGSKKAEANKEIET